MKSMMNLFLLLCMFSLTACGDDTTTVVVSGPNTISGTSYSGSTYLPGVTIALTGAATDTTTTDANGNFSFTGTANGDYVLTPSKSGYSFTPASILVTMNSAGVNSQNFIATATPTPTYSVSGTITSNSVAQSGVIVALTGTTTGAAITDASGNYSFTGLPNGSYTATPTKIGHYFTPGQISVTVSNANTTGNNFTGNFVVTCTTGDSQPVGALV